MTVRHRLGFLRSWAAFAIGLGFLGLLASGAWANWQDERRLSRLARIDDLIAKRLAPKIDELRAAAARRETRLEALRSRVARVEVNLDDSRDAERTILVSTAENRVFVRHAGKIVFEAVCSTGKGTTLVEDGRAMTFETPTGRFRILSKEEDPVWVPPDWHFLEEARRKNLRVVRLEPGEAVDAETGKPTPAKRPRGIFSFLRRLRRQPARLLKVEKDAVIEVSAGGRTRILSPGQIIRAGNAVVIPPMTSPQRRFEKVLGRYRLNIGEGYALHGTLATDKLGRSVTHGCVRLGDSDMEALFEMAQVGDPVIIY